MEQEIEKILELSSSELKKNSKPLDDINATYYWNPAKGGLSIIVSSNGEYLCASSGIGFERLLEEFKSGRRNGKIDLSLSKENNTSIQISTRNYNGHYGKGSIFSYVEKFNIVDRNATITVYVELCIDAKIKEHAKIEITIPFVMTDENYERLNELINTIGSTSDYKYNESHYSTVGFDNRRYNYTDVKIDGINYEIKSEEEILKQLIELINSNKVLNAMSLAIKDMLNN